VLSECSVLTHCVPFVQGKERYVFFSFPHIAIDSDGNVGTISRPNRPGDSSACGALIAVSSDLPVQGLDSLPPPPPPHPHPTYSIGCPCYCNLAVPVPPCWLAWKLLL
jgi:hypothetical protein